MFRVSSFEFRVSSRGDPPGRPYTRNATPETPHPKPETPSPGRRREAGVTLLELLISMTILVLIFVTVLGAVRVGSKSWESGERRAEENQRTRTLFDTLARELTMIYPLRVKDQDKDVVAFRGSADSLMFATLPQSYGAEPFSHMIRVVTYAVEGDRGLAATESYPLLAGGDVFGAQEGRVRRLDDRVSGARFRYLVPQGKPEENLAPAWRDYWDPSQDDAGALSLLSAVSAPGLLARGAQRALRGSDRLPLAVEITLTIRQERQQGVRDLILPSLVFPVQVGRTL